MSGEEATKMFARCPCIPSFIVDPVVDEVEPELTPDTTTRHPFDGELAHVPRPGFLFKVLSITGPQPSDCVGKSWLVCLQAG